jgi:DNA-binding SARP family transcriptional activator
VEFRALGPLEVADRGKALPLGGGRQRALLAVLLLHAGQTVSTDRLIDELWGADPPGSALNSVHVYVSQLRKTLGDGRIVTRGHGYALEVGEDELDVRRFERLFREGRELLSKDPQEASSTLSVALACWRGPALAEFASEEFAQDEIRRLEELRLAALEEKNEAELALGGAARLVSELETLVAANPLRERLRGQLMLALYRSGRQADALAAYREGRRRLVEELGLEPGPELRDLETAILNQDPVLQASAPAAERESRQRGSRGAHGHPTELVGGNGSREPQDNGGCARSGRSTQARCTRRIHLGRDRRDARGAGGTGPPHRARDPAGRDGK